MRNGALIVSLLATVAVVTGVWLGGTQQNPWNLFMPYLFGVAALEMARRRTSILSRFGIAPLVLACAAVGVQWTLGSGRVDGPALLVWAGMIAAIAVSTEARVPRVDL